MRRYVGGVYSIEPANPASSGESFLLPFPCCLPHTVQSLEHALPALCRTHVRLNEFSLVCALPSPAAEPCASLFDWFIGTTAQSDFSSTCMSAARFMAFADRSCYFEQDVQEISRFSCMLFLSVPDSQTTQDRTTTRDDRGCRVAFRPYRDGVDVLIQTGFSKLNSPAHRYLCLRFKRDLAISPARLEARMDSLFPIAALVVPITRKSASSSILALAASQAVPITSGRAAR
jgi:hypothetical protein